VADVFAPAADIVQEALKSELRASQPVERLPQFHSLVCLKLLLK